MLKIYLTFLFAFVALVVFAQTPAEEYIRQQEQMKKAQLLRELDSGVFFMDNGEYAMADLKFRHVLNNIRSVPSDLTYFFGKNSYFMGKYKQSVDWLNKYIQLKGTTGQRSKDAVVWLKKAEEELLVQRNLEAQKMEQQILSSSYEIDCGPSGKVICPVCKGEHVIVKKAAFGDDYKTCPFCSEQGTLTCAEYNLLIRGELKPKM